MLQSSHVGLSKKIQKSAFEQWGVGLVEDAFPLNKLISKEIRLEELPELLNSMAAGKIDFPGKVIVIP